MRKSFIRRYSRLLRMASNRFSPTNTRTEVKTIPKNIPTMSPVLPLFSLIGSLLISEGFESDEGMVDGDVSKPTDTGLGSSTFCNVLKGKIR